jgi:hypothetical protein
MAGKDRLRPGGSDTPKWSPNQASEDAKSRNVFSHARKQSKCFAMREGDGSVVRSHREDLSKILDKFGWEPNVLLVNRRYTN